MEIKVVEHKIIHGLSRRTSNANEMSGDQGKIPGLWQAFDQLVQVDYQGGERVYGVYSNYESDHHGEFDVLAGYDGNNPPAAANLEKIEIPQGNYLVFTHTGEMPQMAIDAWTEVWEYFNQEAVEHQRSFGIDFEYCPNANEIRVHIAVT